MNERIKDLMEQASQYAHENRAGDWEVGPAYQDIFHKKFAELIVQECGKVIFETPVEYLEIDAMHRVRDRVKNHFGVEECAK